MKMDDAVYPYSEEILRKYDIFQVFVLDGGAFFFSAEHIGATSGKDFLSALSRGKLLAPWVDKGRIHWDKAWEEKKVEQHVWLNRLYFLLPIAHACFLKRDKTLASEWFNYFREWRDSHPAVKPSVSPFPSKYTWWDFQPTTRLLVFIHSAFMFLRAGVLTKDQWVELYRSIEKHADHVYCEVEMAFMNKLDNRYNHFLQKGVALIYAGSLFPELDSSSDWIDAGYKVVKRVAALDIRSDGGYVEYSPSYGHYTARLCLDAYLLLAKGKHDDIDWLESSINKQYKHLSLIMSPNGYSLPCGDSYHLDAKKDIQIVSKIFPLKKPEFKKVVVQAASHISIARAGRLWLYVDASPSIPTGSHAHFAKPNFILYIDKYPVIIDRGCHNYDRKDRKWFNSEEAHNVVVVKHRNCVPESPNNVFRKSELVSVIDGKDSIEIIVTCSRPYEGKDTSSLCWRWTRVFRLYDRGLEICDDITGDQLLESSAFFHFANSKIRTLRTEDGVLVNADNWKIELKDKCEEDNLRVRICTGLASSQSNMVSNTPFVQFAKNGRNVRYRFWAAVTRI